MTLAARYTQGQSYSTSILIDQALVERFADLSGDRNPIHVDEAEARAYGYPRQVAHGAILVSVISKIIGMEIPGPGALWMNQSVDWISPVFVGDEINITVRIENVSEGAGILALDITASNQKGKPVMKGKANVKISEKIGFAGGSKKKTDKVALITGASKGLGAAIARRLAAGGVTIAAHYRESAKEAEKLVHEIRDIGGTAEFFQADLARADDAEELADEVVQTFGGIDILVHGASPLVQPLKAPEIKYEDIERYLKVYLGSALSLISKCAPAMIENKFGRLIFLGTAYLFGQAPAGMGAYVTAKEALWGLTKSLATELGPHGITANMISPGMTVTDFTADIPPRIKEIEARKSPARRLPTPEDTSELAAFLAGEAAGYLNGINFPLTGGPI